MVTGGLYHINIDKSSDRWYGSNDDVPMVHSPNHTQATISHYLLTEQGYISDKSGNDNHVLIIKQHFSRKMH